MMSSSLAKSELRMRVISSYGNKARKALVCGCSGFIGSHLVKRLKSEGYWVMGIDMQTPFDDCSPDEFMEAFLGEWHVLFDALSDHVFEEVYQMADSSSASDGPEAVWVMNDNLINTNLLNVLEILQPSVLPRIFYASSQNVYGGRDQGNNLNPFFSENDSLQGVPTEPRAMTKYYGEELYRVFGRTMDFEIRIGRIFSTYGYGDERSLPFALCKAAAVLGDRGDFLVRTSADQQGSFCHIDDCIEGIRRLMQSDYQDPVNLGSDQLITCHELVELVKSVSGKSLNPEFLYDFPQELSFCSSNALAQEKLGWSPEISLEEGMRDIYQKLISGCL